MTGANSVFRVMAPLAGSSILVIGAGAVGMGAIMAAKIAGCGTIISVDLLSSRRDLAMELGATHVVDGADSDLVKIISDITRGGADFAIDAVGLPATAANMVRALRPGGHGVLLGAAGVGQTVELDLMDLIFNRKIQGAIQGDQVPQVAVPSLISLHMQGLFPFERILQFFPFEAINDAVEGMENGSVVKPVLLFD
ncbi:hypothetical protein Sj15T_05460 [Sphingobium sp. TA15]|nr:hypothetical protein Sj15T_05460 [Sphingobium sp. TA15]